MEKLQKKQVNQNQNQIQEAEIVPVITQLATDEIKEILADIEKQIEITNKIKSLSIRLTTEDDWVNMGDRPYLQITGSAKIRERFGISFVDMREEKELVEDEKGKYWLITVKGTAIFRGRPVEVSGCASTRDEFFAKRHGKMLDYYEVDLTDIKKKAWTNFHQRALKITLGFYPTWEDLKNAGLNIDKIKKVTFEETPSTKAEDEQKMRDEIVSILTKTFGDGWKEQLKVISSFTTKDGKKVEGTDDVEKLKGKWLEFVHKRTQKFA